MPITKSPGWAASRGEPGVNLFSAAAQEAVWKLPRKVDSRPAALRSVPEVPSADVSADGSEMSPKLCCAMAVTSAALSPSIEPKTPSRWLWLVILLCSACACTDNGIW